MLAAIPQFLLAAWHVTAQMAPYLLLGFLVAGLLSVFVSARWLERHLGGRGMGPVWKASLLGVPLPLCSCGVIPVAASLRRHGASRAATSAFLLSTPQTGVDSIAVTGAMLGPYFAVFRPLIALVTGVVGGGAVQVFTAREPSTPPAAAAATPASAAGRVGAALRYGFETLPRDIGRALSLGILLAALITVLIPAGSLAHVLGGGVWPVLVMMVVGVPLYVCATGSVPLAAGFIHAGVSPGAALAFLVAGPATNAATLTTLMRVLGRRTTAIYLATVAVSAFGGGLLLNAWMPASRLHLAGFALAHDHAAGVTVFSQVCAGVLLAVLAWAYRPRRAHTCACEGPEGATAMSPSHETVELTIKGMNCTHCSSSVERALSEQAGVTSVAVDLAGGHASVRGEKLAVDQLVAAVNALGFEATPA